MILGEMHSKALAISPKHEHRFLTNCAPPSFWQIIAALSPFTAWSGLISRKICFTCTGGRLKNWYSQDLNFSPSVDKFGRNSWPTKLQRYAKTQAIKLHFSMSFRKFTKKWGNHGALLWVLIKSPFLLRIALTLLHILTTLFLSGPTLCRVMQWRANSDESCVEQIDHFYFHLNVE